MSEYRKAIVASVSAAGALAGLVVGSVTADLELGAAVAGVFVAAGPALVWWVPNAPHGGGGPAGD